MVLFALSCFGLLLFLWLTLRRPGAAQAEGLPRSRSRSPRRRSSATRPTSASPACRSARCVAKDVDPATRTARSRRSSSTRARAAAQRRAGDPAPEDAARRDLRRADAGHAKTRATIPETAGCRTAQVKDTVELDEIFQALDPRDARVVPELAAGAGAGRSPATRQDLNDAFGNLPAFADDATDVLDRARRPEQRRSAGPQHRRRVRRADQNERKLHDLIVTTDRTFDATSRRAGRARRDVPDLPDVPRRVEGDVRAARDVLEEHRPARARPAPGDARPARRRCATSHALAPDLRRPSAPRPADHGVEDRPAGAAQTLDGLRPLLGELQPFLEELNPILQWLEYHQLTRPTSSPTARRARRHRPDVDAERGRPLPAPVRPDRRRRPSAIYPNRPAANRGNAYLHPGALSGQKRAQAMIFPSFDCDNAGGERQRRPTPRHERHAVVLRAATPPAWPPGNKRQVPARRRGGLLREVGASARPRTGRPCHLGAGMPRRWPRLRDRAVARRRRRRRSSSSASARRRVALDLELGARAVEAERLDPRALGAEDVRVGLGRARAPRT